MTKVWEIPVVLKAEDDGPWETWSGADMVRSAWARKESQTGTSLAFAGMSVGVNSLGHRVGTVRIREQA